MSIRKTGKEQITLGGNSIGYSINDFWSWNSSDLLDNTLRGEFSEFIVAAALKLDLTTGRVNWEPWDLTYPFEWHDSNGIHKEIHIEVKSCSYIQSWEQNRPSSVIFSIRPTRAWTPKGKYSDEVRRQSDVYVFCLYTETNHEKADPMVLDGWEFYVLSTRKLNDRCGRQKTISLSSLHRLEPKKVGFLGIESAVCQSVGDPSLRDTL